MVAAGGSGHCLDIRVDPFDKGNVDRVRIAARIARIEAVDIGQQDQRIRAHHLGHPGAEPVIVAEPDFLGRDRVVLVDHGHRAERKQGRQRGAGVQMMAPFFRVGRGKQDLCDRHVVPGQRFLIGVGEPDLTGGGCGLFFFELQGAFRQAEMAPANGDSA